jgi:hypothetical protein
VQLPRSSEAQAFSLIHSVLTELPLQLVSQFGLLDVWEGFIFFFFKFYFKQETKGKRVRTDKENKNRRQKQLPDKEKHEQENQLKHSGKGNQQERNQNEDEQKHGLKHLKSKEGRERVQNTGYEAHAMGVHESRFTAGTLPMTDTENRLCLPYLWVEQHKPQSRVAAGPCTQGDAWESGPYEAAPSASPLAAGRGRQEQASRGIFHQNSLLSELGSSPPAWLIFQ